LTVIVILALVALFIGLRLYSVLGERTGHEQQQPILKPADPDALVEPRITQPSMTPSSTTDAGDMAFLPTAGPGVRAILAADPNFDVGHFLEGAKSAYRMILEAYWKGELDTMKSHVDAHVMDAFSGAVAEREKEGLSLDNRLVAVEQALISEAALEGSVATVTVRFEADIAAVTRNKEGEVVAGSLSDAVQTRDLWTFRRDITAGNPNWLLVETDEEE
jgi:predicted lipid-binding transport protein (Tim44 family)